MGVNILTIAGYGIEISKTELIEFLKSINFHKLDLGYDLRKPNDVKGWINECIEEFEYGDEYKDHYFSIIVKRDSYHGEEDKYYIMLKTDVSRIHTLGNDADNLKTAFPDKEIEFINTFYYC